MNYSTIGYGCRINKAIIAENVAISDKVIMGEGEEVPNEKAAHIYTDGLVTIGERSEIPANVRIGKNTVISGQTELEDYPNSCLMSGKALIKAGE